MSCLACDTRHNPPPDGDHASTFMAGFARGALDPAHDNEKVIADLCPEHGRIYRAVLALAINADPGAVATLRGKPYLPGTRR